MGWKERPYWFKGGIVGISCGFIIVVLTIIMCPYISYDIHGLGSSSRICDFLWIPSFIIFILVSSLLNLIGLGENYILNLVVYFIFLGLLFFLTGMLIGWIVGKIRIKQ